MFQHCCSLGAIPQPLRAGKKQTTSENQGWAGERAARTAPCFSCHPPGMSQAGTRLPRLLGGCSKYHPALKPPTTAPQDPALLPVVPGAAKSIPHPSAALGGRRRWGEGRHLPRLHPACAVVLPLSWIPQPPLRSHSHPSSPWQCSQCSQSRPAWAERSPGRGRQPSPPLPPAKGQGTAEPFPCPKRALGCSRSPQAPTKPQSPKQQKENSPSLPSWGQRGLGFLQQGEAGEPGTT